MNKDLILVEFENDVRKVGGFLSQHAVTVSRAHMRRGWRADKSVRLGGEGCLNRRG